MTRYLHCCSTSTHPNWGHRQRAWSHNWLCKATQKPFASVAYLASTVRFGKPGQSLQQRRYLQLLNRANPCGAMFGANTCGQKMIVEVYNAQDQLIGIVQAAPECGKHFCDRCGDCLACGYGGPCIVSGGEEYEEGHRWVHYADLYGKLLDESM